MSFEATRDSLPVLFISRFSLRDQWLHIRRDDVLHNVYRVAWRVLSRALRFLPVFVW